MALDPKIAAKLLENVPEIAAFRDFVREEVYKLDTLQGLAALGKEEREVAVAGRLYAAETLKTILGPLIDPVEVTSGSNPHDYTIEVDDIGS